MKVGAPRNGNEERKWYGTTRIATRGIRRRQYFDTLSDEQLKVICEEKAPNGCATEEAMEAQYYLKRRKQLYGY